MDKSADSASVRKILSPAHVERHKIPSWLGSAIKQAIKSQALPKPQHPLLSASDSFQYAINQLGREWADHCGRLKLSDGSQALISEPYAERVNGELISQLESFCRTLNLEYVLDANSEWFPGRTLRIMISKKS